MRKKSLLAAALCATAVAGLNAGSAFAGEITGTGESTPIRNGVAASECAFSGLDDPDADVFTHTQSFGQLVSMFGPMGGVPGGACNPTRSG
jgi:hypothetical protein